MMNRSLPSSTDFLAGELAEQDLVSGLEIERDSRAVFGGPAAAGRNHGAALRFFSGTVGDDDPADLLFAVFEAVDEDAIVQRSNVHGVLQAVLTDVGGGSGTAGESASLVGGVGVRRAAATARRRT